MECPARENPAKEDPVKEDPDLRVVKVLQQTELAAVKNEEQARFW